MKSSNTRTTTHTNWCVSTIQARLPLIWSNRKARCVHLSIRHMQIISCNVSSNLSCGCQKPHPQKRLCNYEYHSVLNFFLPQIAIVINLSERRIYWTPKIIQINIIYFLQLWIDIFEHVETLASQAEATQAPTARISILHMRDVWTMWPSLWDGGRTIN